MTISQPATIPTQRVPAMILLSSIGQTQQALSQVLNHPTGVNPPTPTSVAPRPLSSSLWVLYAYSLLGSKPG